MEEINNTVNEEVVQDDVNVEELIENILEDDPDKNVDDIISQLNKGDEEEVSEPDDKEDVVKPDTEKSEYDDYSKEELIEHLKKKDKRIKDKDKFIGNRSSEIGDLRKHIKELMDAKENIVDPSQDDAIENPVESMKKIQENAIKRNEIDSKINQANMKSRVEHNLSVLVETLGKDYDYNTNNKAAIEVLKQDGAPNQFIENFIKNPGSIDSAVTFNILKRAEAQLKIASLEKKIEELSKSKKSLTDNFNKAGKKTLNDIPSTSSKGDLSNVDFYSMTDEQLDRALKKLK